MGNQNSSRPPVVTSGLIDPSSSSSSTQIGEELTDIDKPSLCSYITNRDLANNQPDGIDKGTNNNDEARNVKEIDASSFDTANLVGFLFNEEYFTHDNNVDCEKVRAVAVEGGNDNVDTGQNETSPLQDPTSIPSGDEDDRGEKKGETGLVKCFNAREIRNGKVIGEGGFGRILQGSLHGMPVVIKFFHAPLSAKTLQAEVDALMSLKHKNIIEVYGIVEQLDAIDCPQVVLQYFPEGNVLQYLSRKENPDDKATLGKFALDVIEACQYLQHKNIVHGNLAARNILIEKIIGRQKTYYNAKISDMGIIRFAEATGANYVKIPGTERVVPLRWVPKEIVEDKVDGDGVSTGPDYTFASDVWSFGVMLWEIWTRGAIPYGASYSNMRVIQFLKDGYSPLKVHRPTDCPSHVVSVMESIFKVDASERPTFNELYQLFRSFKGFGRDNKVKPQNGKSQPMMMNGSNNATVAPSGVRTEAVAVTSGTLSSNPNQAGPEDEQLNEEKIAKKKKKKNKFNEKLARPQTRTGAHTPASFEGPSYFSSAESGRNNVARAGSFSSFPGRNLHSGDRSHNPGSEQFSDETTVAALLLRVNQLERERNERRRGRGARRGALWGQRLGPSHFTDGYHNHPHSPILSQEGNSGPSMGQHAPPLIPTPSSSQAPPPYTEDPLPHHSSSRFVPPTMAPEYEYGAPGPSHGRVSRAGSGGRGLVHSNTSSSGSNRGDYLHKVRQLAEEIEFLRAEKMTQELLKKSAELANLMKHMTVEVAEESEPGYPPSRPNNRSYRGRPYQQYGYRYFHQDQHSGWQQESPPDYNQEEGYPVPQQHHSIHNRSAHQYQHQPSSRRPYYGKGPGRGRGFGKRGGGAGGASPGGSMDFAGSGQ